MSNKQPSQKEIFDIARQLGSEDAAAQYLDQVCGDDRQLRARILQLLEADKDDSFLEKPPVGLQNTVEFSEPMEREGETVGRYKLLQAIGEGGFGVVYMAEQQRPVQRKVALKVIKPGMDTKEVIARFEAERQALALMDHPNISRVLDGGATESGRPYFVMELVRGVPITEYSDKNQLSTNQRLELFITVCQAVQHAHQKGVIHRDIKPSNILVTLHDGQPVVKVIDFGVAKAINQQLTEKTLFTAYGQMIGTPQYMSPEQAEMSGLDVDTRSDIYSLGVLLYELLTGVTPLDGERLRTAGYAEMQRLIREEDPPKPSTRLSSTGEQLTIIAKHRSATPERLHRIVRGDLDWIVMKALDKDRGRRYETASAFESDLYRYLDDKPVVACPPSAGYRLRKLVRRNKALAAGVTITITCLFLGITGTTVGLVKAKQAAADVERTNVDLRDSRAQLEETVSELKRRNAQVRQHVLHEAFAAALNREGDKTRRLVATARQAGATEFDAELVFGLLENDRPSVALEHLQNAVRLDESSLAAHSLLASAHFAAGNWADGFRATRPLQELEPTTAEDYLFLGNLRIATNPSSSVEMLQTSLELHDSPVTRLIYAHALALDSFQRRDLESTKKALLELGKVQLFLGSDHERFYSAKMGALNSYVAICRQQGIADSSLEQKVDEATECARQLRDSRNPIALTHVARHYDHFCDDLVAAEEAWMKVMALQGGFAHNDQYAAFLLRKYGMSRALKQMEGPDFSAMMPYAQTQRIILLALSRGGYERAEQLWTAMKRQGLPTSFGDYNWVVLAPFVLGKTDEVESLAEAWTNQGGKNGSLQDFCRGVIDEQTLLSRGANAYTHYWIAMKALSRRDATGRNMARQHLQSIVDIGNVHGPLTVLHLWALGFLAAMADDPDWPAATPAHTRPLEFNSVQD